MSFYPVSQFLQAKAPPVAVRPEKALQMESNPWLSAFFRIP
jgi:hypothetical protein